LTSRDISRRWWRSTDGLGKHLLFYSETRCSKNLLPFLQFYSQQTNFDIDETTPWRAVQGKRPRMNNVDEATQTSIYEQLSKTLQQGRTTGSMDSREAI
jgi:hypothetical protein